MKIAIAGGHSKEAPGASGLLNEYECDRSYVAQLIPALRAAGHEVVDCSNESTTANAELAVKVRIANNSGADLFVDVHLNAGGGTGTECWYYEGNEDSRKIASALSANVAAALGLPDRGAKATKSLYVLGKTRMDAVLLEVCFVDRQEDKDAWDRTSWDSLTKAVVDALGGTQSAPAPVPAPEPAPAPAPVDTWGQRAEAEAARQGFSGLPTVSRGAKGNLTRLIQEKLISLGYSCGGYGADGVFGAGTGASVRAFQRDHGLTQDGIVGPATWSALCQA